MHSNNLRLNIIKNNIYKYRYIIYVIYFNIYCINIEIF